MRTSLQSTFRGRSGARRCFREASVTSYRHPDWLGSSRLASLPASHAGMYSATAYGPYGEAYDEAGTRDRSFTGQNQDIAAGVYDFPMREYSPSQGRWWTSDPAGLGAVDANNPQSWNRFAYVAGNPLSATDPLGLCSMDHCHDMTITVDGSVTIFDNGYIPIAISRGGRVQDFCLMSGKRSPNDGKYRIVEATDHCIYDRSTPGPTYAWTPPPPLPTPQAAPAQVANPGMLACMGQGVDDFNPARLIGLGGSNFAKGVFSGPFSAGISGLNNFRGEGSRLTTAVGGAVQALDAGSRLAASIPANPVINSYAHYTTIMSDPLTSSFEIPVRQAAGGVASFFEKINPLAYIVDFSLTAFVGIACAAVN
ncbi:MAG: RHS repeat-associated core domain-containing protein [Terriglobales bacterium]